MSEKRGQELGMTTTTDSNPVNPVISQTSGAGDIQGEESRVTPEKASGELGRENQEKHQGKASNQNRVSKTNFLTKTAILGVMAFLIMTIEFPLPMFAPFLQIDFSDVPALLAGFALGPAAGVMVEVIKNFLHAFRTQTAFIGEISNLITGILLVVPAAWVYSREKTKKSAIKGLLVGTVVMAVGMSFVNYYITIPLFQTLLKIPITAVVAMGSEINPLIVDLRTLVVYSVLPFNIVKGLMVTLITVLIYKKLSPVLHR